MPLPNNVHIAYAVWFLWSVYSLYRFNFFFFLIYTHMVNLSSLTILDIIHMLVTFKVRSQNISLQILPSYVLLPTMSPLLCMILMQDLMYLKLKSQWFSKTVSILADVSTIIPGIWFKILDLSLSHIFSAALLKSAKQKSLFLTTFKIFLKSNYSPLFLSLCFP